MLQRQPKLIGVEFLRFLCALGVVLCHYQNFALVQYVPVDLVVENQPFYAFLRPFYRYGIYGVQVFWCISGYIFFWKYKDAILTRQISKQQFFVLRFSRLYPLHLLTLGLVALLQTLYLIENDYYFVFKENSMTQFISHLFLASDWGFSNTPSFNGPIWSVSVEVLAYLIFYLVTSRFGATLKSTAMIILVAVLLLHFDLMPQSVGRCIVFFYAGGGMALIDKHCIKTQRDNYLSLFALGAITLCVLTAYGFAKNGIVYDPINLLLICSVMLVHLCVRFLNVKGITATILEAFGNMTYSSYLLHFPLQLGIALICSYKAIPVPLYDYAFFISFILLTFLAAFLCYNLLEIPLQSAIRKQWLPKHNH